MKVLWHSNAPWASTGYGQQTALFAARLNETHDVAISAFYGLEGSPINWKGIAVLPGVTGTYGNETVPGHARAHLGEPREGLVLTLMDVWVLHAPTMAKLNTVSWTPVDHDPVPPRVARYFEESSAIPLAMSRFGEERLAEFDPIYVPHAVDTKVFAPINEARELAGFPKDAFVVGMVAANKGNPSRKAFPQAFKAFQLFHEKHPEAVLALHTEIAGEAQGIDLRTLISQLELTESVVIVDQYRYKYMPLKPAEMAAVYSSMDVLLNPAMGEGFGIPVLEAQACGTPAIVTNFSAMAEVCGAGWKVAYNPVYMPQMSYQADPLVEDILAALEASYALPAKPRETMAKQAREHAMAYDIEAVMAEHMLPALEEAAARFGEVPVAA